MNIKIKTSLALLVLLVCISFQSLSAQLKPLTEQEIEQLKTFNSLEKALENPDDVQAFFLNKAQLEVVPKEIESFKNMIVLGFGINKIKEIPGFIFNLENLQHLGFSHNQISEIPEGISKLKNLTSFKCWNNSIKEVPDALLNLPNIQIIELKGNPILKEEKTRIKKAYPNIKFLF